VSADLSLDDARGRWVLLATVLGSGVAMLDATVVSIALPTIGRDLGGGLAGLQWIVTGYTLTLAACILLGGSLGDLLGRRRVFVVGAVWFGVASLLCALAPSIWVLVAARALQGIGGALMTPGSLAILSASFAPRDRARAIGAWSGLGGVAGAIGPFVGGYLLDVLSWRWLFLINVPLIAVVVLVAQRYVPETRDSGADPRLDVAGAVTGAVGLAAVTYGLVALGGSGSRLPALVALGAGIVILAAFVVVEQRSAHPMVALEIFASRMFTAVNVVTLLIYAALSGVFFLLALAAAGGRRLQPAGRRCADLAGDGAHAARLSAGWRGCRQVRRSGVHDGRAARGGGGAPDRTADRARVDLGAGGGVHVRLRRGADPDGRATDGGGARRGEHPVCRPRLRHQQRRCSHRRSAGGGWPPARSGPSRRRDQPALPRWTRGMSEPS
jgi:MFS family permease